MKLVYWPSPILKQVSVELTAPPDPQLVVEMQSVMRANHGAGLSAIQLGVPQRLVVVAGAPNDPPVFVNPVIKEYRGEWVRMNEGCLSVPGFFEKVRRNTHILVKYRDVNMVEYEHAFIGFMAHVLQHELEHLDGKMYLDHLPAARKSSIIGNMQRLRRLGKLK